MVADAPRILKWVIFARDAPVLRAEKAVLFALASRANREGICWPSWRQLRADAGLSRNAVRDAARALEHAGWISIEERPPGKGHRQGSNRFALRGSVSDP